MEQTKSEQLFEQSKKCIPGGVNSPVRAYQAVGSNPVFIERAKGSKIYDVDGREYIDYVCSWGPCILGHCDKGVIEAVKQACDKGLTFGAPTEAEYELAMLIKECMPSMEMTRLVSSGTEAVMSAVRVARSGIYGKEEDCKVQRVLSRTFRRTFSKSRFRCHDPGGAGQRRSSGGFYEAHADRGI